MKKKGRLSKNKDKERLTKDRESKMRLNSMKKINDKEKMKKKRHVEE